MDRDAIRLVLASEMVGMDEWREADLRLMRWNGNERAVADLLRLEGQSRAEKIRYHKLRRSYTIEASLRELRR